MRKIKITIVLLMAGVLAACGESESVAPLVELNPAVVTATPTIEATEADEASEEILDGDSSQMMSGNNSMSGGSNSMNSMAGSDAIPVIDIDAVDFDEELSDVERAALETAVANEDVARALAAQSGWQVEVYEEDGALIIELFTADWEEWLGYVVLSMDGAEIYEVYAPRQLTAEEFQKGQADVIAFIQDNGELQAVLGNPAEWEQYIDHDPFEGGWYVWFGRGLEELEVTIRTDEESGLYYIENMVDPTAFTNEEQLEAKRNEAIEIAYGADGIDEALDNVDDWKTFVSPQSDSQWAVSFVTQDEELFFALVDIESNVVLDSR